jgi:glycosyltransferase involved in cell wall biosynthesis
MNKLDILRCGDQNFWAYYWIAQEHSKYTKHDMSYAKHDEVNLGNSDIVYIHSPNISNYHADVLPLDAKMLGQKVIGQYSGEPFFWSSHERTMYVHADIVVAISPQTYFYAKNHYKNTPVIYMPECIDSNFFQPKEFSSDTFLVGWSGGVHKKIKRFCLTKQLDFPVMLKDDWKAQRYSTDKRLGLDQMKEFYKSIDVLIVTSQTECQPRVVMEAMATGIPVVASDVGSMRMLLDNEWVVDSDSRILVAQMNDKLKQLQSDPILRKEVGERNRRHVVQYFDWKNNQTLWDNFFINVNSGNYKTCEEVSWEFLKPLRKDFTL